MRINLSASAMIANEKMGHKKGTDNSQIKPIVWTAKTPSENLFNTERSSPKDVE